MVDKTGNWDLKSIREYAILFLSAKTSESQQNREVGKFPSFSFTSNFPYTNIISGFFTAHLTRFSRLLVEVLADSTLIRWADFLFPAIKINDSGRCANIAQSLADNERGAFTVASQDFNIPQSRGQISPTPESSFDSVPLINQQLNTLLYRQTQYLILELVIREVRR